MSHYHSVIRSSFVDFGIPIAAAREPDSRSAAAEAQPDVEQIGPPRVRRQPGGKASTARSQGVGGGAGPSSMEWQETLFVRCFQHYSDDTVAVLNGHI